MALQKLLYWVKLVFLQYSFYRRNCLDGLKAQVFMNNQPVSQAEPLLEP